MATLPANAATTNQNVSINSISCASAGNCSAVGSYVDGSGSTQGLLLSEVAGIWGNGVEAVLPANAASASQGASVNSVSCSSAGNCAAVGSYSASSGTQGLLLTETAGRWATGIEASLPANASTTALPLYALGSVSCVSAGNCSAVGTYLDSSGNGQGLLLTETTGHWATGIEAAVPPNAATANQTVILASISCPWVGDCSAVGSYFDASGYIQGLLLSETAGSWGPGVEAVGPAGAYAADVSSVSCPSAGNCAAVGNYGTTPSDHSLDWGLLLRETGGKWESGVEAPPPTNPPVPGGSLNAVTCPSAGNCTAVGSYGDGSGLLLTEADGHWTSVEAVLPPDATPGLGATLGAVSCASTGNCTAVGGYDEAEGAYTQLQGLVVSETAGTWSNGTEVALPTDLPLGGQVHLSSISCPTADSCSGVGSYGTPSSSTLPTNMQGLLLSTTTTAPPKTTLTVSKTGAGSGTVTSSPAGIDCGSTCTFQFSAGTKITLTAAPTANSAFLGWSGGDCSRTSTCQVTIDRATNITATFATKPQTCVVPKVKHKTLTVAKRSIKSRHCSIGRIKHIASHTVRKGHVISQRPGPGSRRNHGAKVNLAVSNGRHTQRRLRG